MKLWMRQQLRGLWWDTFTPVVLEMEMGWDRDSGYEEKTWLWHRRGTLGIFQFILWFLNPKHEHMSLTNPFLLSLPQLLSWSLTFTFLCYTFLSLCPPSSFFYGTLTFCPWLTQGITPTPNTAELKQTHLAAVKINHFLFFFFFISLSLSLFLCLSLSEPLFKHSENKRLARYLFYVGRPDHRRVSFGPFQPNLLHFPVKSLIWNLTLLICHMKLYKGANEISVSLFGKVQHPVFLVSFISLTADMIPSVMVFFQRSMCFDDALSYVRHPKNERWNLAAFSSFSWKGDTLQMPGSAACM